MRTFGVIAVFALQAFGAVNHGSKLVEVHGLKLSLKVRVRAIALGERRDAESMNMESNPAGMYHVERMIMLQLQQFHGALATINNGTYLRETASSPLSDHPVHLFNGAEVTILDTDLLFLADGLHVPMVKVQATEVGFGDGAAVEVGWLELKNLDDIRSFSVDQEERDAVRKQQTQPVPPATRPPQPAPQPAMVKKAHNVQHVAVKKNRLFRFF